MNKPGYCFLLAIFTLIFSASLLPTSPAKADTPTDATKQIVETPISAAPTYAKRALVIGIDGYQNVPKLTDCNNDANQFAAFLRNKLGFTDVTVMTDDRATPENLQPTYTHITRQFNLLLDNIVANQTQIVVFYSGHGVRTENGQDGDADWLVPVDADPNDISHTCYDYSRFKSVLDTKQPARALLIMDACRNILTGKAAVGESGFGGAPVPLGPQIAEMLSCQPTQTSLEGDPHDFSESVFTHFLLEGLMGDPQAVDPNTHAVTFDSLMAYVQGHVTQYAQTRLNSAQQPTGDASFGGMVLASFGSPNNSVPSISDTPHSAPMSPPSSPKPAQPGLSLKNLQNLGAALRMYLQDSNGKLPRLRGHSDISSALLPYLPFDKGPAMLIDPSDGIPYLPNTNLSGRTVASFKNPSHIVFCYESLHAPDGTRGILFLDGNAKRLSVDEWIRAQRASGMIPE
jgi:hypothetical protein